MFSASEPSFWLVKKRRLWKFMINSLHKQHIFGVTGKKSKSVLKKLKVKWLAFLKKPARFREIFIFQSVAYYFLCFAIYKYLQNIKSDTAKFLANYDKKSLWWSPILLKLQHSTADYTPIYTVFYRRKCLAY